MDKIPVTCRCGKKYAANPQRAGEVMRCPSCGADIAIPDPNGDEPELVAAARRLFPEAEFQTPSRAEQIAELDSWMARMPNGQEFGPVEYAKLQRAAAAGKFPPGTMVRKTNQSNWQPVEQVVDPDANAALDGDYNLAPDRW